MARNQITLILSALGTNLVIPYSNEIALRSLEGTYQRQGSTLVGTPILAATTERLFTWQLSIPQTATNQALLEQLIYLQETGSLGDVVLRDEAQPIPSSWLAWGNKTAYGSSVTLGAITARFFQCPVAITIDPQYAQAIGAKGTTNWWRNVITAYELPA